MKRLIMLTGAAAALLLAAPRAGAQLSVDGSATVTLLRALTLSETTAMSWGSVARPGNGTADYTLNYSTGAVTLSASTSTGFPGFSWDNGAGGVWAVTGEPSTGISFSVAIGAFDGTGVSVQAAHINGTSNSGTGTLSGGGAFTLNVGGIIRVTSAATLGVRTATVTVTVDYT